jgi:PAS domain S-box-containing protein
LYRIYRGQFPNVARRARYSCATMIATARHRPHIVQYYRDGGGLLASVAGYLREGLERGEPVVIVATPECQAELVELIGQGERGLTLIDANQILARIMVGSMPDPDRFVEAIGLIPDGARVYNQLSDLLWRADNSDGARRLEQIWIGIGQARRFSLLCPYRYQEVSDLELVSAIHGRVHAPSDELEPLLSLPDEDPDDRLSEAELRLRLLIDSIQDYAIFMLEPNGRVATWNPGAERIKGYAAHEIIGTHLSAFYPDEDARSGKCELELRVAAATGRFEDEGWRVRKDGSMFWANVVISAVRDRDGRLVGFAKVTRDLTERRRAEIERAARLAAEESSRAKDEFFAMLGHELRNPLAPIITAVQVARLRGSDLRELDVIERQAHHLIRLVDDLLDVSRITRGKVELVKERIELADVVAQAIETTSPLLEQYQHVLTLDVPRHDCAVTGDRARLAQVVSNLLTNAAKYSEPRSTIAISAASEGGRVKLRVVDSGIGIEPHMLASIFDTFVQNPQAKDRSMGGLGLGLAIVRSLVHMHGGTVVARSQGPGTGSEFEIDLPRATAADLAESTQGQRSVRARRQLGPSRRILIVDDNQDAAALLAEALLELGHQVRIAHDGMVALETAGELMPEVALLDIGLPVMDGYELATRLRKEPWAGQLRLVAITGYGLESDRERSRAAGFDAHVVKPLDLAALERLVHEDPS